MNKSIVAFAASLLPMLALDALWLTSTFKRFYVPRMAHLLAESPSFAAAGIFYLIYAAALSVLVVMPAARRGSGALKVFLTGALFGLACYATYDLTNQAVFRAWPLSLTLVDMAWGTLLTGTVSLIACSLTKHFAR
jgi:uncharacterized membrane protein